MGHDAHPSSHQELTTFLKATEEDEMVKLEKLKAGNGAELVIMGVFPEHLDVEAHRRYARTWDVEDARAKKER